jgi:predicted amidohydrolase
MAKFVTVCSLGYNPLNEKFFGMDAIERMMEHWKNGFAPVLPYKPDLIVLPEACDRFSCHTAEERQEYYSLRGDKMQIFFSDIARANALYIAYSAERIMEDGTWRNSTQIIDRSGAIAGLYNKNYSPPRAKDKKTVNKMRYGKEASLINCDFGTVGCAICYDLNFDELRLEYTKKQPDIILFSSMYHGGIMQQYWAYSIRSYFIGAIAGLTSTIISPVGMIMAESTNYFHYAICKINLDCEIFHLDGNKKHFQAVREKYGDGVKISCPDHLGSVLMSSEMEGISIKDILKEFELEPLDDYFKRSRKHRLEYLEP